MAEENVTSRLMSQVSEELIKPFTEPIRTVYIDSDFLYDYRLGTLLLKIKNEQEYNHIIANMSAYEKGTSRKIMKYFPDLKITEEDLDLLEGDFKLGQFIPVAAPATGFLSTLPLFILKVNTYNHSKEVTKPLRLVINQRKHIMPIKVWKELVAFIRRYDQVVRIERTNYASWEEVPDTLFNDLGIIAAYDLTDFVKIGTASQKAMVNGTTMNKVVVSYRQVEKDYDKPEDEEEALLNFQALMSTMFSEFSFVSKSIPLER